MNSIPELYSLQNSQSVGGVQGYFVEKKYIDPAKMKQQRILSQSKQKPKHAKPVNVGKKTTFIDDIQKSEAKLPGPTSYDTSIQDKKSKIKTDLIQYPDRHTYIDEIQKIAKKKNIPGAGTYSNVVTSTDKSKLRSDLRRAESPSYAEACMRNSLDAPGVGQYNAYRAILDHRGSKWVADPEKDKKKASSVKFPSVGAYNPTPSSYKLFSSISGPRKKSVGGLGGNSERFKTSKEKKLPFYNILSEWGMKNKLQKKDILCNISSRTSSQSVYY